MLKIKDLILQKKDKKTIPGYFVVILDGPPSYNIKWSGEKLGFMTKITNYTYAVKMGYFEVCISKKIFSKENFPFLVKISLICCCHNPSKFVQDFAKGLDNFNQFEESICEYYSMLANMQTYKEILNSNSIFNSPPVISEECFKVANIKNVAVHPSTKPIKMKIFSSDMSQEDDSIKVTTKDNNILKAYITLKGEANSYFDEKELSDDIVMHLLSKTQSFSEKDITEKWFEYNIKQFIKARDLSISSISINSVTKPLLKDFKIKLFYKDNADKGGVLLETQDQYKLRVYITLIGKIERDYDDKEIFNSPQKLILPLKKKAKKMDKDDINELWIKQEIMDYIEKQKVLINLTTFVFDSKLDSSIEPCEITWEKEFRHYRTLIFKINFRSEFFNIDIINRKDLENMLMNYFTSSSEKVSPDKINRDKIEEWLKDFDFKSFKVYVDEKSIQILTDPKQCKKTCYLTGDEKFDGYNGVYFVKGKIHYFTYNFSEDLKESVEKEIKLAVEHALKLGIYNPDECLEQVKKSVKKKWQHQEVEILSGEISVEDIETQGKRKVVANTITKQQEIASKTVNNYLDGLMNSDKERTRLGYESMQAKANSLSEELEEVSNNRISLFKTIEEGGDVKEIEERLKLLDERENKIKTEIKELTENIPHTDLINISHNVLSQNQSQKNYMSQSIFKGYLQPEIEKEPMRISSSNTGGVDVYWQDNLLIISWENASIENIEMVKYEVIVVYDSSKAFLLEGEEYNNFNVSVNKEKIRDTIKKKSFLTKKSLALQVRLRFSTDKGEKEIESGLVSFKENI